MDPHPLAELEFPRILELAASLAGSEPGRRSVLAIHPTPFPGEAAERLAATAEMVDLQDREGRLDLSGLVDLEEELGVLAHDGSVLLPPQFRALFGFVACSLRLRRQLAALPLPEREGDPDGWPILREQGRLIPDLAELDRMRARLFDAEGEVRDDATPELARIRRALASQRDEVQRRALAILRADPTLFQDATVVQRGGRTCLPLRAEFKGRVPGILHERSQTGATFFVEPMAIVELNNEMSALREEESAEILRILRDATAAIAARREEIADGLDVAVALDALQARALFSRQSDAIRPEIAADGQVELFAARHPLLDERLAPLRRRVFGEAEGREKRRVVPVDVVFQPGTRVMVLTGPNAGGKTATLKVLGLSAAMVQSGFFLPAAPGSRLPVFDAFVTHMGDAQDILADLSSFSSYMTKLAGTLPTLSRRALVLLDELGSATDPEEGGALAAAILEEVAAAGATAAITTHLGFLKGHASRSPGFAVAAMEYDGESGRPTYRILPGVAGRSLALSLAERAGVAPRVLSRARALLGEGWQARERAEVEFERARGELEREKLAAAEARREREEERDRLAKEREAQAEAARRDRLAHRREMDRLKRVVDESLTRALNELRGKLAELAAATPRALAKEVDRLRAKVLDDARAVAPATAAAEGPTEPLRPGEKVRLEGLGTLGILRSLEGPGGERAVLEVAGKTMKVETRQLVRADAAPTATMAPPRRAHPAYSGSRGDEAVGPEINLLGRTVEEAIDLLDDYLDRALLSGRAEVRVIHGYGTGRLKAGVTEYLKKHRAVSALRPGDDHEGGGGATVVTLDA